MAPALGFSWAPAGSENLPPPRQAPLGQAGTAAPQGPRLRVPPFPDICEVHIFHLEPWEGRGTLAPVDHPHLGLASSLPLASAPLLKGQQPGRGAQLEPWPRGQIPPTCFHAVAHSRVHWFTPHSLPTDRLVHTSPGHMPRTEQEATEFLSTGTDSLAGMRDMELITNIRCAVTSGGRASRRASGGSDVILKPEAGGGAGVSPARRGRRAFQAARPAGAKVLA